MMVNKREREIKIIAIVALLVAVAGLSIAYAALSTTLRITGNATVNSATWQVQFVEGEWSKFGDANATGPTFGVTTLSNISVTLVKPGDKAVYEFKVANNGTIPATLSTETAIGTISCTGGANQEEANATCNDLTYSLVYKDTNQAPKAGDVLANGSSMDLVLTVEFNETATTVPSSAVTVNGITATLEYVQS